MFQCLFRIHRPFRLQRPQVTREGRVTLSRLIGGLEQLETFCPRLSGAHNQIVDVFPAVSAKESFEEAHGVLRAIPLASDQARLGENSRLWTHLRDEIDDDVSLGLERCFDDPEGAFHWRSRPQVPIVTYQTLSSVSMHTGSSGTSRVLTKCKLLARHLNLSPGYRQHIRISFPWLGR